MFIKIPKQDNNTIIYYKLRDSKFKKINNINNAKYNNTIQ